MRLVTETGQNFSGFLAARLLFVTVLIGVSAIFRVNGESLAPHLMLFTANIALSLGCWEWYKKTRNSKVLLWFTAISAMLLDTILLRDIGGSSNEFAYLFFFTIGSFALLIGLVGSLTVAGLSIIATAYLQYMKHTVFIPEVQYRLFLLSINFVLEAFLLSYIFEKYKQKAKQHAVILDELEQTKFDTQAILDSLGTGLVVLDKSSKAVYFNPAGCEILAINGSAPYEVEQKFSFNNPMGAALKNIIEGKAVNGREEVELENGKMTKPIGLSASPFYSKQNQLRGYIVLFSDLTKHKERERLERGRERLAAVGSLARELAHEIRNPLATVRGCVEVMCYTPQGKYDLKSFTELALKESDRLNELLRDFLTFSNIDSPVKKTVNVYSLIQERLESLSQDLKVKNLLPSDFSLECDEIQMSLVVDAVILSLAEWQETGSEIIVSKPSESNKKLRFFLENKIVPEEYKEAVFTPFSKIHKKSRGLALATAGRVIHGHGGSISLQSESDKGTWFEIEI